MPNSFTWIAAIFLSLQVFTLSVSAIIGCAAEANFQACKSIEQSVLQGCGPVDYACQCNAQKLIRQCYDLCPEYSVDANEQARVATGICAAVPTSSAVPLPSISPAATPASSWAPSSSTGAPTTLPSSSQSVSKSAATSVSPIIQLIGFIAILVTAHHQLL